MVSFQQQQIIEVLEGALHRLESGWTTGHQARARNGRPVHPESKEAVTFCMFGALRAEALELDPAQGLRLAEDAARYLGSVMKQLGQPILKQSAPRTLMQWNDAPGRNVEDVLDIYRQTLVSIR